MFLGFKRGMRKWPIPPTFKDVLMPPLENRTLPVLEAVPALPITCKPIKYQRRPYDERGPELIHNRLMYNQYGIIALGGGKLTIEKIDRIRNVINKYLDTKKAFAVWRIDPPWKSATKKGVGKRMGGGKLSTHHYYTPVKSGRILVEVGGMIEFEEVYYFLNSIAVNMPMPCAAISSEIINDLAEQEKAIREKNVNPINYKRCIQKNILNCRYDMAWDNDDLWFGKYL